MFVIHGQRTQLFEPAREGIFLRLRGRFPVFISHYQMQMSA
tara:strand:- start:135 stop:257 length:123 start_codon:yes stop_codon:yes gene_type:complete